MTGRRANATQRSRRPVRAARARDPFLVADPATPGSLLHLAPPPSVASCVFWIQAVEEVGADRAGAFLHLMPAFGSILAAALPGESFRPYHLAGIALIPPGVTLAGRGG